MSGNPKSDTYPDAAEGKVPPAGLNASRELAERSETPCPVSSGALDACSAPAARHCLLRLPGALRSVTGIISNRLGGPRSGLTPLRDLLSPRKLMLSKVSVTENHLSSGEIGNKASSPRAL